MQLLIRILTDKILKQCRSGHSNLIRIENIDNPIIYHGVCLALSSSSYFASFVPKLSREKYNEFSQANNGYWSVALNYFQQGTNYAFSDCPDETYLENSFVDFNNAMTRWRNKSADIGDSNRSLILLLGTEAAPDTGGLTDTSFVFSPKELVEELKMNYGAWFAEIIDKNGLDTTRCMNALNTLYRIVFQKVNTDIFRFSSFIDSLDGLSFSSDQELISHICETLNEQWGIPSVIDSAKVPRVIDLNKGKLNSAKIITSAIDFVKKASAIPTEASAKKLDMQFEIYAQEMEISSDAPFPSDNPVFADYASFKTCVIDFMCGKNKIENRSKLLKLDYAIIYKIIGTKLPRTSKTTSTKLFGDPIEIYAKMFLHAINQFYTKQEELPTHLSVQLNHVSLTDCVTGGEEECFGKICTYLGGIVEFFNAANIELDGNVVQFSYKGQDGFDPFNLQYFSDIKAKVKCSGKWGEPSKIDFSVTASNSQTSCKSEFRWAFSPYSGWLNSFFYLVNLYDEQEALQQIPTMVACQNIQDYLGCESDDEFYAQIPHMQDLLLAEDHLKEIGQYFGGTALYANFIWLRSTFSTFMESLSLDGLFASMYSNSLYNVVTAYSKLMVSIQDDYLTLTSVQREKLPLLLNVFMITSNSNVLNNCDMGEVILPAYHPVLLEKIVAKYQFIREGFTQALQSIQDTPIKKVNAMIQNLVQLSSITQGVDSILKIDDKYIPCKEMWEFYGVYYGETIADDAISGGSFATSIVADDETAATMLTPTPMSSVVVRNILDYVKTFPSRIDGLNIAFIAPSDMQHIVAAIHKIAAYWNHTQTAATINIKIISINSKKNSATYLRRWLDTYFADSHLVKVNTSLRNLTIHSHFETDELKKMLKTDDLCFIYQILHSKGLGFQKTEEDEFDVNQAKFPMTFTPDAIAATHGKARNINISQFQFLATRDHTQASHIAGQPDSVQAKYRVFEKLELTLAQAQIIDVAHDVCKWVVCIDKAIDRRMLEHEQSNSKIIGFTTGEGCYGELNVTVSARSDVLFEIKGMLRNRITEKFPNWDNARLNHAATYCVDELSHHMDGSRILKALNPYDYEVHSFLAYTLMIQILGITQKSDSHIIRRLISLDSYRHWFKEDDEFGSNNMRPDFMLLEIPNTAKNLDPSEPLDIQIKIIECKMAFQNDEHISKATMQLEKGLKTMVANWTPNQSSVLHRYWLNQLYRSIIFSPINKEDSSAEFSVVRNKIHGILHGNYQLHWGADLYAFWLDFDNDNWDQYALDSTVPQELRDEGIDVDDLKCHCCGQMVIQKMLLPPNMRDQPFEFNECAPCEDSMDILGEDQIELSLLSVFEIETNPTLAEESVWIEAPEVVVSQDLVIPEASITDASVAMEEPSAVVEAAAVAEDTIAIAEDLLCIEEAGKDLSHVRFLLGEDARTKHKYYWEFGNAQLNNRHLLINGNSGCGKTYCIQALLMESALQGISSVVFDYTGGFAGSKLERQFKDKLGERVQQRIVRMEKISINPFKKGKIQLDEDVFVDEDDVDIAGRIAETFTAVYKLGDQQKSAVYTAVLNGARKHGELMSFLYMYEELEAINTSYSRSVQRRIQEFIDFNPFAIDNDFNWSNIRDTDGIVYVIQLVGYNRDIQLLLTQILLWDIWSFCVKTGDETKPFILVLDEAQNLSHGEKSPSAKILTEGRKFGISGWFATQFMKPQLSDDEIQRLQQAGQKLYFCPPDDGIVTVSKSIDITAQGAREWAARLKKLQKGECVTCGNMVINDKFNKYDPRIIKITSLEERT